MNTESTSPATDQYSVVHSTFNIERTYPVPAARVFHAFSDQATKRRWFVEGEGWEIFEYTLDFRVGGREYSRFQFQGHGEMSCDTLYMDIIPDRRMVFAYSMTMGSTPISASLATIELLQSGDGTLLTYTEQGAYFDSADSPRLREQGCRELLEKLAEELETSQ